MKTITKCLTNHAKLEELLQIIKQDKYKRSMEHIASTGALVRISAIRKLWDTNEKLKDNN